MCISSNLLFKEPFDAAEISYSSSFLLLGCRRVRRSDSDSFLLRAKRVLRFSISLQPLRTIGKAIVKVILKDFLGY